jgi:acyl-[acyl-carrier-protein]-phospholipid O-acyltransferase/long-chain-fatty-acid--[acyl-carrier-protein] ligase
MQRPALGQEAMGFRAYLATQFLGAFNDNAYKFLLLSFITARTVNDPQAQDRAIFWAQFLFAVPFVLLAAWAGVIADRYRKTSVFVWAKLAEVGVMLGVTVTFFLLDSNGYLLFGLLFLMSVQSTFFGPAKYGWLGERFGQETLSRANGVVSMTTFAAIILGQIAGGALYDSFEGALGKGGLVLIVVAVLGTLTAVRIPRSDVAHPEGRLKDAIPELRRTMGDVFADKGMLYTVLGIGHFFLLAALLQVQLFQYAENVLGTSKTGAGVFVATCLAGMGVGSMLAARWSEKKVELGLVPMGAVGMSACLLMLAFVHGGPVEPGAGLMSYLLDRGPAFLCVFALGIAGGLFIVPLNANLQFLAPETAKGRFLAFGNMVSFIGVFLSAGVWLLMGEAGLDAREKALAVSIITLVGTSVSVWLLPEAFLRLCGWLLAHSIYRIRVLHTEHVPETGGALLVANHVSWVDWLVLAATTRRRIRFMIYREYFEWWPVRWLFRLAHCIPIATGDKPEVVANSLAAAADVIEEGHLVVIFVEGSVTRTGHMQTVRRGYQRIAEGRGIRIIPVYLDGLWGSIFSHSGGRLLFKVPRAVPYPVTVSYGNPLPARAEPWQIRAALQELATDAWTDRKRNRLPLHMTLLRERRHSVRTALFDPERSSLSRGALIARALALRDALAPKLGAGREVGVLLPNGLDGVVAILAVLYAGRVPIPLNTTLGAGALQDTLARAKIDTVLTNETLRGAVDVCGVAQCLDVNTFTGKPARGRVIFWRWMCWLLPFRLLEVLAVRGDRRDMDAPATVLFTAGSTGEPKGIVLSHHNVLSSVEGVEEVLDPPESDRVLGLLPFFQAIGFVQSLWVPLLTRAGVAYVRDPLDGRAVGRTVANRSATIMFATPRLLQHYRSSVRPWHFGSLRLVYSTGERLLPSVRAAFNDRFGLAPFEAYSATECSSLIALNTEDVREAGVFQRGSSRGSVGHPLPGVSLQIVDPATGEMLPNDQPGMLRVRAPSVMSGYLDDPEGQSEVMREGWYVSGDMVSADEHGFLTLTGRASRMSLIDGRDVSHSMVEEAIVGQLGEDESPVAVLARRNGTGGDELVVFYRRDALDPARVVSGLERSEVAASWRPRVENFVAVDEIPLLPTGTVDYRTLQRALDS